MEILGVVFILLDVTYYSGKSTGFLLIVMGVLVVGDFLLDPKAYKPNPSKGSKILEKIIFGLLILTIIGFATSLAYLCRLGPFGRLESSDDPPEKCPYH